MSEKTNIATLDYLNEYDPAIGNAMTDELKRQRRNLELIASENIVSPAVMAAMGSLLTNKYAEGYPGKRYYGGCQCVDVVEEIARKRACELFGAEHANVQPHSGAQANTAVYFAMLNPGDTVMGMNLTKAVTLHTVHLLIFQVNTSILFRTVLIPKRTELIMIRFLKLQRNASLR